ncbi:MAG: hypothetical protein K2Q24_17445 [Chitinophagaceae bacterium]|jgi:hypothetical protein|nr:hypothetical protein [Chitinophagaceae bacterium]
MKAASIHELKQELQHLSAAQITDLCLRLARFKKENKELLTYLLFDANDTAAYIKSIQEETDLQFKEINHSHVYFTKKTLRKIVRTLHKYIRYCSLPEVEIELLVYFCNRIKAAGIPYTVHPVLLNLYNQQVKRIEKAIASLHEDLQYDYLREVKALA